VQQGEIRRDVEVEVLAGLLLSMLRARARDLADVPEDKRPIELIVELFWRGASAGACGAGSETSLCRSGEKIDGRKSRGER
jgi:hypothetical protein